MNQGYGVVCDIAGNAYDDLIVADANQEHGIITVRPGSAAELPKLTMALAFESCRTTPNWYGAPDTFPDGSNVAFGAGGTGDGTISIYAGYMLQTEWKLAGASSVVLPRRATVYGTTSFSMGSAVVKARARRSMSSSTPTITASPARGSPP